MPYKQIESVNNLSDHLTIALQLNCNIEDANPKS